MHRDRGPIFERQDDAARSDPVSHRRHPAPGQVSEGNTVGDASPEARAQGMSVELNVATATFLDETYVFSTVPARSNSPKKRATR
jgi:hypothetical protein